MSGVGRSIVAGLAGLAVFFAVNAVGIAWLRDAIFEADAYYDGFALFLTLIVPSLLGGLLAGWLGREHGLPVAALAFLPVMLSGLIHPLWRIPPVSPHSARSGLMHYFLYNPLVALAFGALGGWLGSQFATGRFTLADAEPVLPPGAEE